MTSHRPTSRFWLTVLLASACMLGSCQYVERHWRIGIDGQQELCLPYRVFAISRDDVTPRRDAYFAFRTRGLAPWFADGTVFLKQMAGMPGDRVRVLSGRVWVNDVDRGALNPSFVERLGRPMQTITHDEVVPAGRYLMLGTLPGSFDGRYWGTITVDQLIGRGYPLW